MRALLIAISALFAAQDVAAQSWPTTGGWDVVQGADHCGIGMEFEGAGSTELYLILRLDGEVVLGALNSHWSTVVGQEYNLSYVIDQTVFGGGASLGYADAAKRGFISSFENTFATAFAAGRSLKIFRDDVLVDQLSLSGSGAALGVARRCLARVRSEAAAAERERARLAHIPRDPFAGSPPATAADGPTLISGTIVEADYPPAALRAGEQGTVTARVTISEMGRVTACSIAETSGSRSLDDTTCRLIRARFRYSSGASERSTVVRHQWTLNHSPRSVETE